MIYDGGVLVGVEECRYLPWPRSYVANSLFGAVCAALVVFCIRQFCVWRCFLEVFDLLHELINPTHGFLGRMLLLLVNKVGVLRFLRSDFLGWGCCGWVLSSLRLRARLLLLPHSVVAEGRVLAQVLHVFDFLRDAFWDVCRDRTIRSIIIVVHAVILILVADFRHRVFHIAFRGFERRQWSMIVGESSRGLCWQRRPVPRVSIIMSLIIMGVVVIVTSTVVVDVVRIFIEVVLVRVWIASSTLKAFELFNSIKQVRTANCIRYGVFRVVVVSLGSWVRGAATWLWPRSPHPWQSVFLVGIMVLIKVTVMVNTVMWRVKLVGVPLWLLGLGQMVHSAKSRSTRFQRVLNLSELRFVLASAFEILLQELILVLANLLRLLLLPLLGGSVRLLRVQLCDGHVFLYSCSLGLHRMQRVLDALVLAFQFQFALGDLVGAGELLVFLFNDGSRNSFLLE